MKQRILLVALLVGCSFRAFSAPAELQLPPPPPPAASVPAVTLGVQFQDGLRLQEFTKTILRDVLKAQFVFSTEFLSSEAYVAFSANNLKKFGSEALLRDVLSQHGFSLENRGGYYRVFPAKPETPPDLREDFVYRLKHRDLAYISSQIEPLFESTSFTFKRGIDSGARNDSKTGSASDGKRPTDTGKSLYSMTTNTSSDLLIFRGLPAEVSRLKAVLSELDVPVPRVLVRALILETRKLEQSGFSVAAVAKMLEGKLGFAIGTAAGANTFTFSSPDFSSVAAAFASDANVNVLTAPSVFAETGASAALSVGASVPTLGAIQYDNNGRTQQSVSYQETGVILRVTPRVLDESISLNVQQEISDAVQTQTGVSGSPTITKSSLTTSFNLKSGDTVILGGLTATKDAAARDSLPFWRSLTLGRTDSSSKSDIVIVLHVERI